MKPLSLVKYFARTLTLILLMGSTAFAGPGDLGGGNAQVAEFYWLSRTFTQAMELYGREIAPDISLQDLKSLIADIKVSATTRTLEIDGEQKDAVNSPSTRAVEFNSANWEKRGEQRKLQLVVHEILGLLRISDLKYEKSNEIVLKLLPHLNEANNLIRSSTGKFYSFTGKNAIYNSYWQAPEPGCKTQNDEKAMVARSEALALAKCRQSGATSCYLASSVLLRNLKESREGDKFGAPHIHDAYIGCYASATAFGFVEPQAPSKGKFKCAGRFKYESGSDVLSDSVMVIGTTKEGTVEKLHSKCLMSQSAIQCEDVRANAGCTEIN